jgi:hypothetical protein
MVVPTITLRFLIRVVLNGIVGPGIRAIAGITVPSIPVAALIAPAVFVLIGICVAPSRGLVVVGPSCTPVLV